MPSPSIFAMNSSRATEMTNEVYIALFNHILNSYKEIWEPASHYKDTLIKQMVNEVIPYYEGLFGIKMTDKLKVDFVPRYALSQGTYQVTMSSSKKIRRFVKFSRKKVGRLAKYLEQFKTGSMTYQVPFFKLDEPKILIPSDQPVWISLLTLPHELFHAYMFSTTFLPPWSYQSILHELSTAEYTAEVMSAKFLNEEYGLKLIFGEPINVYEYVLYKLDYLLDPKDSLKFIKNILFKEYIYDNEVFTRFKLENLVRVHKAWSSLYEMSVLYGSFFKYISLQHAVKSNYGIIFNLLNPQKLEQMYEDIVNGAHSEFYKMIMNVNDFYYKPYGITTDRLKILLILSEKINKLLVHYIPPYKELSDEDIELIRKFTKFGNPDPEKNPNFYKNKFRLRGLFEYFAYEPAVKKKVLSYKDFWQDPREFESL